MHFSSRPCVLDAYPFHPTWFDHPNNIWWSVQVMKLLIMQSSPASRHILSLRSKYECVSKSFRTGCLERELHVVQLSATRCSCIAILWVSLVSFAAIILCVASQRVLIVIAKTQSGNFWIHLRILPSTLFSMPSIPVLPLMWETKLYTHTKMGKIMVLGILVRV
jgi:hypothetical protein